MARSYRKTPILPFTSAKSEKSDKQSYNRKLRRRVKSLIHINEYENLPSVKSISNIYEMSKDGKFFVDSELYLMDKEHFDKVLRK